MVGQLDGAVQNVSFLLAFLQPDLVDTDEGKIGEVVAVFVFLGFFLRDLPLDDDEFLRIQQVECGRQGRARLARFLKKEPPLVSRGAMD